MTEGRRRRALSKVDNKRDESGQSLVEYALILLLVAMAVIAGLSGFGLSLADTYDLIAAELPF